VRPDSASVIGWYVACCFTLCSSPDVRRVVVVLCVMHKASLPTELQQRFSSSVMKAQQSAQAPAAPAASAPRK
jgi:hypothetical protein